jgi:hypothetical protein
MFVSKKQLVIYCQMLPKTLWYKKQVQIAKSTVLKHRSLLALITIDYIAFNVSAQALLIIAQRDKLKSLGFS